MSGTPVNSNAQWGLGGLVVGFVLGLSMGVLLTGRGAYVTKDGDSVNITVDAPGSTGRGKNNNATLFRSSSPETATSSPSTMSAAYPRSTETPIVTDSKSLESKHCGDRSDASAQLYAVYIDSGASLNEKPLYGWNGVAQEIEKICTDVREVMLNEKAAQKFRNIGKIPVATFTSERRAIELREKLVKQGFSQVSYEAI